MNLFANQIGKLLLSFILFYSLIITPVNAGIPEPETIIYGKIINNYEDYDMLVTSGMLEWQIVDVNSEKYTFSALLEKRDNDYSYVLSIPKETAASIILHSGTYLFNENYLMVISDQAKKLKHSEIIVNGYKAQIIAPASNSLSIDQETRLDTFRIDLKINYEPPDTDKDGIPDFWEEKNNFNIDSSVDAALDSDDDGWSNIHEFQMGSNPNLSNKKPSISDDQSSMRIPEGTRTILNLMVLDSDSKAEDILIKLIKPPTGGELILCSEIQSVINDNNSPDKILEKDDTFSAQDLISAKVHLKHTDPKVDNMQMQIKLWNKESENEAMDYTINAYVCYPTKDQNIETSLWINMFKNADKADENAGINSLTDFSGNNNNSVEVFGFPVIKEKISPSGNDALFMDGRSFFRFGNDPISDKTTNIFSVFKSTGSKNQSLWAGTNAKLGLTDSKNSLYPGKLNLTTQDNMVYGKIPFEGKWLLSSINMNDEKTISYVNNRLDQIDLQPFVQQPQGVYFQIGAEQQIVNDDDTNELKREYVNQFEGYVAEILMISQEISPLQKWRVNAYLLSKWFGYILNDSSEKTKALNLKSFSSECLENNEKPDSTLIKHHNYVLIAGLSNDTVEGSSGNDILIGGQGQDQLQGNAGSDIFVVGDGDTIVDFNNMDGDVIHIADIIDNGKGYLTDYIQIETNDTFSLLKINADGEGEDYTDAVIRIENNRFSNRDIAKLWANGNIESGGLSMPLIIKSNLIEAIAEESSKESAEIEIIVESDVIPEDLFIPYNIDGDAKNGEDFYLEAQIYNSETGEYSFEKIESSIPVKLKPGDTKFIVKIIPVTDNISEHDEYISLGLKTLNSIYTLGNDEKHEITLKDGMDRIKIESNRNAIRESNEDLIITISRTGSLDAGQNIDLLIKGSAVNGEDFTYIPSTIYMLKGESENVLKIKAFTDEKNERMEVLEIKIDDSDYYVPDNMASSIVISIIDKDSPIANAGKDILAKCGDTVVLDATASVLEENTATFKWAQMGGVKVEMTEIETPNPKFIAPMIENESTVLKFELVVTDLNGTETTDTVDVFVNNPIKTNITDYAERSANPLRDLVNILLVISGETDVSAVDLVSDDDTKVDIKDALFLLREIAK